MKDDLTRLTKRGRKWPKEGTGEEPRGKYFRGRLFHNQRTKRARGGGSSRYGNDLAKVEKKGRDPMWTGY